MSDTEQRQDKYGNLVITWDYLPGTRDLHVNAKHINAEGGEAEISAEEPYSLHIESPSLKTLSARDRLTTEIETLMPYIESAAYGRANPADLSSFFDSAPPSQGSILEGGAREPNSSDTTRLPGAASGDAVGTTCVNVKELGNALFESLFHERKLRDWYMRLPQDEDLRIRIRFNLLDQDADSADQRLLARLPWECLRQGDDDGDDDDETIAFWGVDPSTPVIRDVRSEQQAAVSPIADDLRVLLVSANPRGSAPLQIESETRGIVEGLEASGIKYDRLDSATLDELREALLPNAVHVLHFIGHGCYDKVGGGKLLFHQKPRTAAGHEDPDDGEDYVGFAELVALLKEQRGNLRLVFINACNTGAEGENQDSSATRQTEAIGVGGLATSILKLNVPAVIAMQFQVGDNEAITFATEFYKRVAEFRSTEEAVTRGRAEVMDSEKERGKKSNFWATPVLYMRAGAERRAILEASSKDHVRRDSPPADIDSEQDFVLWFTEHRGKLVMNWRINGEWQPGDEVALYVEEPLDADVGVLLDSKQMAQESGNPDPEVTEIFLTDRAYEPDKYHIAYLGSRDGDTEILESWPPSSSG